jgi:pyruvate formate-lyase/glycerol dehydratase family glycyl radical enzyme
MSERTEAMMVNTPIKAQQIALEELTDEMRATRPGFEWKLDLERARLLTESYKQTENEPTTRRRAKALAHILDNMTIYIRSEEMVVGNFARDIDSVPFYPEFAWKWIVRDTAPGQVYSSMLTDEGREELKEICDYWGNSSLHHRLRSYLPDELKEVFWIFNWESSTPNYEKILRVGLKGILEEVRQRKEKLEEEYMAESMTGIDYVRKRDELDAMSLSLEAAIRWAKRYAAMARDKAEKTTDPSRKEELERIAHICEWVPENPARTFHEALQSYWLIHLIINFIEIPMVGTGIRFDQVMNRFYEKDVEEGRIDRDQAQELVEFLIVKFQETGFLHAPLWSGFGGGTLGYQTVTLGGVDSQGKDITNEMSYIFLDAVKTVKAIVPPLALRWHDGMPEELVRKSIEVLASGMPQPAIFNDKVNVPRLVELGCSIEDAREYSINNCMVPTIPGKNFNHISAWAAGVPLPMCMNAALDIPDPIPFYKKAGPNKIDPATISSVQELLDATVENYKWVIHRLVLIGNISDALYKEYAPRPFLSTLIDDCIDRAEDVRDWNYQPDYRDVTLFGLNTVADSLAAIKKLVFDEKKVSMEEMVEAIRNNWQGQEKLKRMCLQAPKFGNDDDYVDLLSLEFASRISEETMKCKTNLGSPVIPDGTASTAWWSFGRVCAATADGRQAGDPFNDGTISPMTGRDKKGPTAVLKSVAKVDPMKTWNHLFNQTVVPEYLTGHNAELFAQYLKTFGDLGIHHIQFTTVGRDLLQDAQKHPEAYPNLMVRVAGFAAYFIDLDKNLQEAIIDRTPQSACSAGL